MFVNNQGHDPPSFRQMGASRALVSNSSTNSQVHPFLITESEEVRIPDDQVVPRSNNSSFSASMEEPILERDTGPMQEFKFKIEVRQGRPEEIAQQVKEHLNPADFTVLHSTVNERPGTHRYTEMEIEIKSRKVAERLMFEVVDILFVTPGIPRFVFEESSFFSSELSVSKSIPLNALNFCSRQPNGNFFTHWQISYEESYDHIQAGCRNSFKADFLFAQKNLSIHCWDMTDKEDLLSFGLVQIDFNSIRNVVVSPRLVDGQIQLILELEYPVTIKKKRVPLWKLESDNAYTRGMAYSLPDKLTSTLDRGRWEDEAPLDGVLTDCRHVELDMSMDKEELYELLSRIHNTIKVDIIFEQFNNKMALMPAQEGSPFMYWVPGTEPFNDSDYIYYLHNNLVNEEEKIILTLRLKTLAGMNMSTKNQLLSDRVIYRKFYETMIWNARVDFKNCLSLIESMILCIERESRPAPLVDIYTEFADLQEEGHLPYGRVVEPGQHYENAETIEITPSGVHFKLPELHNGNLLSRLLRRMGKRQMIRCALRTENGEKLRWTLKNTNKEGEQYVCEEVRDKIKDIMMKGIEILGVRYTFFAASSSQLTELGMFLMDSRDHDELRNILGDYVDENPHKNLAREGQCTSQSMECPLPIEVDMWDVESDKSPGGYCKTDGAGRISLQLMEDISRAMGIWPCVPEGFQFRFLCFKGMLFVDRQLKGRQIMFRESQKKYNYGTDMNLPLQIIKYTGPQTANFCASFINIIDQNAERQGEGQERIREAILDLNEKYFVDLAVSSIDETAFRARFKNLPRFIELDDLKPEEGWFAHQDPLWSSFLEVDNKRGIDLTISKNRISLDPSIARSIHGAPDDIGLLEEDEVYIEITVGVNCKYPGPGAPSVVWEGDVLLWKNPLGHPGDVRIVKCVNRPEYNGQVNKIIFSKKGDRPLFDMLSGSDLDGDEYGACLLKDIMPSKNEEPMDYTAGRPENRQFGKTKQERRVLTYLHTAQNNNTGMVSVAHLVKSDELGLHTAISMELAKKACLSLDMPKSGILCGQLRRRWITVDGIDQPPEFPHRRPDFRAVPQRGATYRSPRLNGVLNRLNRQLLFVYSTKCTPRPIKVNPIMEELLQQYRRRDPRGMAAIEREVEVEYESYSKEINELINSQKLSYSPEAELFTGSHLSGKGFERKESDYSNVSSKEIGGLRSKDIFRRYRQRFFDKFHKDGYLMVTRSRNPQYETDDVLDRTYVEVTDAMKKWAVACYVVCYRKAAEAVQPILTYGWVAYDVLAFVQKSFNHSRPDFEVEDDSFYKKLETEMESLRRKYQREYDQMGEADFYEDFLVDWIGDVGGTFGETIQEVLFAFVKWAKNFGLVPEKYSVSRLLWVVLALGYGLVPGFNRVFNKDANLETGKTFVRLFSGLASRHLAKIAHLPICRLGEDGKVEIVDFLEKEELHSLYETSRKCYYHFLINRDLTLFDGHCSWFDVKEREPRIIELPLNADLSLCAKKLAMKAGAEKILLKPKDSNRIVLMYRGSWQTEERIREIVEVPPLVDPFSEEEQAAYYSQAVYSSIFR